LDRNIVAKHRNLKGMIIWMDHRKNVGFLPRGVIPDFKDKIRYTPYVSFRSQISHIATNKE
jgi:hypothetical protein